MYIVLFACACRNRVPVVKVAINCRKYTYAVAKTSLLCCITCFNDYRQGRRASLCGISRSGGKRIINLLDAAIYFSQIICILPHTNLANLTKAASQKARSCRLRRVFTNRMASTSVASALREICEICVKINHLCENILVHQGLRPTNIKGAESSASFTDV